MQTVRNAKKKILKKFQRRCLRSRELSERLCDVTHKRVSDVTDPERLKTARKYTDVGHLYVMRSRVTVTPGLRGEFTRAGVESKIIPG